MNNRIEEIELSKITAFFYNYKYFFLISSIIGILLGYVIYDEKFTRHLPFTIIIDDPILSPEIIHSSIEVKKILNQEKLKNNTYPKYIFDDSTKIYEYITTTEITEINKAEINNLFTSIFRENLKKNIDVAKKNNSIKQTYSNSIISWTNKDIIKVNPEEASKKIVILFGDEKHNNLSLPRYLITGLCIGLIFSLFILLIISIYRELKSPN